MSPHVSLRMVPLKINCWSTNLDAIARGSLMSQQLRDVGQGSGAATDVVGVRGTQVARLGGRSSPAPRSTAPTAHWTHEAVSGDADQARHTAPTCLQAPAAMDLLHRAVA